MNYSHEPKNKFAPSRKRTEWTKKKLIRRELSFHAKIGQSFDVDMFVTVYWGFCDYFNRRSFEIALHQCLKEDNMKGQFAIIKGKVTRIKMQS